MSDQVQVNLVVTETVKYSKTVTMSRAEYDKYDKALTELRGYEFAQVAEELGSLIDRRADWMDADDVEIETFEIVQD